MLPGLSLNSSRIHEFVTSVLQQCGGTFVFKGPWFGSLDSLLTSNPANVHHILRKKAFNYHKGLDFKEIFAEIFGDGIFCSDGDRWKTQRRTIHSFIKHSKFEEAVERIIQQKVSQGIFVILQHFSEQRQEVDMKEVLKRFLFDFVCLLMLGFDPNSLSIEFPRVPYKQAYYDMEEVIFQRHLKPQWFWKLQKWLQIGEERKMKISSEIFDRLLYQCIWRKKELLNRRKTPMDRDDFNLLTFMLFEDNNQEEREMSAFKKSEKYARDMAFNLLSAGSETVSSGDGDGKGRHFSFEELSKLNDLHAAICESLWLYPPLPFEHTVSVGSDTLPSGHQIGKYTRAIYSPYSMGRMEEIWGGDCLEFKPERWISNKGELGDVSPYKFTSFNAGPRAYYDMELREFSQRTQMHPSC
ncbi:p450 domain-containing protein [Salix suchowensis]|nr:p450 domain-containing protein [Salix suchowensis]